MRRSYEFNQEINHTMHETIGWDTYYPSSHEEYYHAPPPPPPSNMKKMLNHPTMPSTYHYEHSDDEDNHHHQVVVHDGRRRIHHHDDHDGNHGQYGVHHHADEKNNKHRGSILRPPLGYVGRNQSYPNLPPKVVDEVKNHTGYVSQHGPQIGVDQELGNKNGYAIASQHKNHHSPPNMPRYSDENQNRYSIASQHKNHHNPPNMRPYSNENQNAYTIPSQHKNHHSPPNMPRYSSENQNGYAIASQHQSPNSPPNMPRYSSENQNEYAIASQHQSHHGPHQKPHYGSEGSRIINNNHNFEDYSKIYPSYDESRYKDNDYYGHTRKIGDDYIESLLKGMNGMVKKIEVIEYERSTYRGGRQEWKVLSNGYPKSGTPWVKRYS